mmetsp:Transcript_15467/g.27477  ORF Transcript_15467/g.27477 Transcript_15467/m.27477 type:complete len:401 (+) Transcript_15467:150-1352(+)
MFDLDVVVIGGGIAGSSVGIFLLKAGYKVTVYERAEKILPVGAAISVWSNGVKVMNRLGLGKEMVRLGGKMDYMTYRTSKDEPLVKMALDAVYKDVGERAYPVARGELQQLLLDTFVKEGGKLVLGKTCVGVELEGELPRAVFDDGTKSHTADMMIAADGLNSVLRKHVLQRETEIKYKYTNWNGLIPMSPEIGDPTEWIMFVGDGKRASLMPVAGNKFYFFMGCPLPEGSSAPPRGEAMRDELKELFKGWPKQVQALINAIDVNNSLNRIPICDHDPLPKYSRGRVVLIGDSAHSTTPTLGQGGCQAMEDAEVLSSFLSTTNISIEDAFDRYAQHRKDRVHSMVLKARERTQTIYPTNAEDMKLTQAWYEDLKNNKEAGDNILKGITANLKQGPWPPRL